MPQPTPTASGTVRLGGGELDLNRGVVRRSDGERSLTTTEVDLLKYFLARPGVVVERAELLRQVWGYRAGVVSRAVDHAVKRLRAKIEADRRQPEHLLTVTGRGYRFVLPTGASAPTLPSQTSGIPELPDPGIPRPDVDTWLDANARAPGLCWISGPAGGGKSRTAAHWARCEAQQGRVVAWVACGDRTEAGDLWPATMRTLEAMGTAVDSELPLLVVWDDTDALPEDDLVTATRETCRRLPACTVLFTRSALRIQPTGRHLRLPRLSTEQATALLRLRSSGGELHAVPSELLDAVDHRARSLEALAPYLGMFPSAVLKERARTGTLPPAPTHQPHGLRVRSADDALAAQWAALRPVEQALVSQCMALPVSFQPMDIESLSEPGHAPPFQAFLALRQSHAVLADPAHPGWVRMDPLLRQWWHRHAPPDHKQLETSAYEHRVHALTQSVETPWTTMHPLRLRELELAAERAAAEGHGTLAARLLLQCGTHWRRRTPLDRQSQLMSVLAPLPLDTQTTQIRWWVFCGHWLLRRGDRAAATATCMQAIEAVREQADPSLRSSICREVGILGNRLPLPVPTLELLDEAVTFARDAQTTEALALALSARGGHHIDTGRHADAEADLNAAIHLFESMNAPGFAARCRGRIATLRKLAGRHDESMALFRSAIRQMAEHAAPYDRANIRMNHANLLADLGRLKDATRWYNEAIELCRSGGETAFEASIRGSLATVLAEQQRHDEARLAFSDALRVHDLNGSRKQAVYCTLGLAELAMDTDDLATAADLLADLDVRVADLGMPQLMVALALKHSVWHARSKDAPAALAVLRDLASEMESRRNRSQLPMFRFAAGLAHAVAGDPDAAQQHADALRSDLRRMGVGRSSVQWRRLAEVEDAIRQLRRARGEAVLEPEE